MATSRTIKWTTLIILLCLTFFLGSFNATMRIIVNQRKETSKTSSKKSNQESTTTTTSTKTSFTERPHSITFTHTKETQEAFQKIAFKQAQYAELKNPTVGKYRTLTRPLDEFPSDGNTHKSYQRQDRHHDTPHTNSTHTVADAHFAKALRMLSSPFDRHERGGNALPPKLYGGNYRQDTRGEAFVKMNWLKRGLRRKKMIGEKSLRNILSNSIFGELPEWCLNVMDRIENWYYDAMSNLYDILGVEIIDEEQSSGRGQDTIDDDISHLSDHQSSSRNEEDIFSWSDTRVGSQLIYLYGKIGSLWTRHPRSEYDSTSSSSSSASTNESTATKELMSKEDHVAIEGLYHLEQAANLGHSEAQQMVANSLASGILPLSDHSLIQRYAKWQHMQSGDNSNLTALLANSTLEVPDDFSSGGEQLSRAILLWHMSAMDGNIESAMSLGYRHLYSAAGGTTKLKNVEDGHLSPGYLPENGGATDIHGTTHTSHYGVLGTCPTALAYYEAAANGIMDVLESGPTRGKVPPPIDEHRLAQIHMRGGASVALENHNKPDEIEEALQYYRMLASRNRSPEPDLSAAFTIANFYHLGLRGVKQDLRLALKYYEICGDYDHWEGGGIAGLFHVWGIGMRPEERDLGKAVNFFMQGTPGGIDGCNKRITQRKKNQGKDAEETAQCDRHSANGMGLVSLLGVDGLIDRNVATARKWFEIAKNLGDADGQFNYAMLRLGWMVTEVHGSSYSSDYVGPTQPYFDHGSPDKTPLSLNYLVYRKSTSDISDASGPTASDFAVAVQELTQAAHKGHFQAKHRLGILYATGAEVKRKNGKTTTAVKQSCIQALQMYKTIAENGYTVSQRNRAAWKQYNNGDYESALRNYLVTAESGNVAGQMNAAFLLEQGYCLGLSTDACTRASVRLWRSAARQGSLESCLRVGDFYYYGRLKSSAGSGDAADTNTFDEKRMSHVRNMNGKALYFVPGPYRWTRYLLYPEEAVSIAWSWLSSNSSKLTKKIFLTHRGDAEVGKSVSECSADDNHSSTCKTHKTGESVELYSEVDHEHMAIAAQYYRKAAEDHKSARANFNLGFMYEWGLGLNQDFPLAKRHYDLAREEADIAASLALFAMGIHEKILKHWMYLNTKYFS